MSLDRIDIEGTFNFRDLGGAPVGGGESVATGKVFRADGLAQLTDRSREELRRLGITTVLDLRDIGERAKHPDALAGLDVDHIELPIFEDRFFPAAPLSAEEMRELAETTGLDLTDRSLRRIYDYLIDHFGPRLALAVDTIANRCGDGIVFHCSAGKDRTGLVAAFVLDLLGVDRDDILDDYTVTEDHLGGAFLESVLRNYSDAGISGNLVETATAAPRDLLAGILDSLTETYGDDAVEKYLLEHGMDPQTPARLRQRLLEAGDDRAA
ncbi:MULTISPECIES: tyrosine-protein phosphatase [Brevibacterium]|uniref:Protein tyrosine/serine phosphatase n=2 Tax=Brevibacterium casei TaxID=33889 RepID=K9ANX4_9MICO|nr:tyrosine-protein phosphatase [Brevibacterium casei]NJE66227.1 tyrosine-protein phosphatase [Brevibacterium sp. LS14]SIJ04180.1 phosphotyrosine protein phosphatase [Mycobacteroides abscessus subsp. abscessus]EKU49103.1 protein tyrosine/serine phosphatase [Brevibacterium casei S18]KZE18409.1 protein tyrosine phosphatase [Brevibacterium casei]MBE4695996.1 tyrosine-protein phosphatase [Brevibacterium casei]